MNNCELIKNRIYEDLSLLTEEDIAHISSCPECRKAYENELEMKEIFESFSLEAPDYITPALRRIREEERRKSRSRIWKIAVPAVASFVILLAGGSMVLRGMFGSGKSADRTYDEIMPTASVVYSSESSDDAYVPEMKGEINAGGIYDVPTDEPEYAPVPEPGAPVPSPSPEDTKGAASRISSVEQLTGYLDDRSIAYEVDGSSVTIRDISDEELDMLVDMLDENAVPYCADEGILVITME